MHVGCMGMRVCICAFPICQVLPSRSSPAPPPPPGGVSLPQEEVYELFCMHVCGC